MAKGRDSMYEMMTRDKRRCTIYNKNSNTNLFKLDEDDAKLIVSKKIIDEFSADMQIFVDYMTRTMVEGILNDRR